MSLEEKLKLILLGVAIAFIPIVGTACAIIIKTAYLT